MPLPTATASTSVLFLLVLILAFFPNLFITILSLPFALLFPSKPLTPILPTCDCCPTAHCFPAEQLLSSATTSNTAAPSASLPPPPTMSWTQKTFSLPSKSKGSYLVTDHVLQSVPEIRNYKVGLLNLFVQHTSCALSLNENWDEDVRDDMTDALDRVAPEDNKGNLYRHSAEGLDDMPAHIKSALVGASVTIPIKDGRLATGTWQGIWYLEFRAYKHTRKVVATIQGEKS